VSHDGPLPDCGEVALPEPCPLLPTAEVALEDYARALTGARAASAVSDREAVVAVHLCGLSSAVTAAAQKDIVDFARELRATSSGGGLGWS
jgi:hypothetical protein